MWYALRISCARNLRGKVEFHSRGDGCQPRSRYKSKEKGTAYQAHDESSEFSGALAHAPAAVPRSGEWPLRFALDPPARFEGLLGHGRGAQGISQFSRHLQRGALAGYLARRICQRRIQRTVVRLGV